MSAEAIVMTPTPDSLMSEKQFLKRIGVSRATLSKFKSDRKIIYYRVGRRCLYDEASYQSFLDNCARRIETKNRKS